MSGMWVKGNNTVEGDTRRHDRNRGIAVPGDKS